MFRHTYMRSYFRILPRLMHDSCFNSIYLGEVSLVYRWLLLLKVVAEHLTPRNHGQVRVIHVIHILLGCLDIIVYVMLYAESLNGESILLWYYGRLGKKKVLILLTTLGCRPMPNLFYLTTCIVFILDLSANIDICWCNIQCEPIELEQQSQLNWSITNKWIVDPKVWWFGLLIK